MCGSSQFFLINSHVPGLYWSSEFPASHNCEGNPEVPAQRYHGKVLRDSIDQILRGDIECFLQYLLRFVAALYLMIFFYH